MKVSEKLRRWKDNNKYMLIVLFAVAFMYLVLRLLGYDLIFIEGR